jgi:hypothetical protein
LFFINKKTFEPYKTFFSFFAFSFFVLKKKEQKRKNKKRKFQTKNSFKKEIHSILNFKQQRNFEKNSLKQFKKTTFDIFSNLSSFILKNKERVSFFQSLLFLRKKYFLLFILKKPEK